MSWQNEERILQLLGTMTQLLKQISQQESTNYSILQTVSDRFQNVVNRISDLEATNQASFNGLASAVESLSASQASCCSQLSTELEKLDTALEKILQILVPPPAVTFIATITLNQGQGENMGAKKATADLAVADNGTFTVGLKFLDADGVATSVPAGLSASYVASDSTPGPSALTLTPSADTSSAAGTINQTTIQAIVAANGTLPVGLTVTVNATWTGLSAPLTVVADPAIDVVPGPASSFVAAATTP